MKWAPSWQNLFIHYANNKDADQPAHPHSLISTFIVRCLDSTNYTSTCYFQSFKTLASLCSWAGRFESYLVTNSWRRDSSWHGSNRVLYTLSFFLVCNLFCREENFMKTESRKLHTSVSTEPRHEKTCLRGFRPGQTQTGLLRNKDQLESRNFGFSKYRYDTT